MKILLTGSMGQLGWELSRILAPLGELVAVDREALDLSRPDLIPPIIHAVRPRLIVNAAGYTAVDRAESEPALARLVNAEAPGVLAREGQRIGAALIHFSTDYVFDGATDRPYRPSDRPNPLSVYGRTKHEGEQAILVSGVEALILRTSWVYSGRRSNFLLTMLRLASIKSELRVVDDQYGSPTPARLIAEMTAHLLRSSVPVAEDGRLFGDRAGIHHLVSSGITTWYGFAKAIFEMVDVSPQPALVPIRTEEYPTAATRPRFSALDGREFEQSFHAKLPDWRRGLARVIEEELPSNAAPPPGEMKERE